MADLATVYYHATLLKRGVLTFSEAFSALDYDLKTLIKINNLDKDKSIIIYMCHKRFTEIAYEEPYFTNKVEIVDYEDIKDYMIQLVNDFE